MAGPRLFEKHCCGLQLRNACIFIGLLEIILSVCLAVFLIAFDLLPVTLSVAVVSLNILVMIPMVVGAIRRQSNLFWPYVIVKIISVFSSAAGIGFCLLIIFVVQWTVYAERYNIGHDIITALGIVFSLIFLITFILNGIPILIVRNYQLELMKRENQDIDMTAAYNELDDVQDSQQKDDIQKATQQQIQMENE